jgi:hypothetical protein
MRKSARPLLVIAAVAAFALGSLACAEPKPGDTLDKSTSQTAEGLLPEEILKHYRQGEYVNPIAEWPVDKYTWPPDLLAGTKSNEGKFAIGPEGGIIDKATGKQPAFIIGHPFPTVEASDPQAAVKALWNFFYRTWYFGNLMAESQVNWVGARSLERRSDQDVRFMYYDGVPEDERPRANPENFLSQQLVVTQAPADLNGTSALTYRYRDPGKRDSSWAYVPALRRVRAVSPANRSDGFLGSDMSQDDGPFFDGKPEDFDWKLTGKVDQLRLADSRNLEGKGSDKWADGKGWNPEWPDLPFIGYMDPEWRGAGWAPRGLAVLVKRPFWVIEGTPRDKYYLFGKLQLYIDAVTYQGAWNRKFSWKGELLNTLQVMAWNPVPATRPSGKVDYNQGSNMAYQVAENIKMNRATVAGIKSSPTAGFYGRVKFDPGIFDVDALARHGK